MYTQAQIIARIEEFKVALIALYTEEFKNFPIPDYFKPESGIELIYGKKNCKVAVSAGCARSVYCFIDMSNGDILKAAGWKAPAKGKRGSIFNENCDVGQDKPCSKNGSNLYR